MREMKQDSHKNWGTIALAARGHARGKKKSKRPRGMKLSAPRDVPTSPKLAKLDCRSSPVPPPWKPVSQAELSDSWLQYGARCELSNVDLRILRSQEPLRLTSRLARAYAQRLQESIDQREWERCTVVLAVFVRSDLTRVVQNDEVYYFLERLAQLAITSNTLDAPDAAGTTARFGRILLNQLLVIGNQLDAAAKPSCGSSS